TTMLTLDHGVSVVSALPDLPYVQTRSSRTHPTAPRSTVWHLPSTTGPENTPTGSWTSSANTTPRPPSTFSVPRWTSTRMRSNAWWWTVTRSAVTPGSTPT